MISDTNTGMNRRDFLRIIAAGAGLGLGPVGTAGERQRIVLAAA